MNVHKFTLAALATLGLALTGCGSSGLADQPDTEPVATSERHEPPRTSGEQTYLTTLDKGNIDYSTPETALDAGRALCEYFQLGGDFLSATQGVREAGYSNYDAGYITGAAQMTLCPNVSVVGQP